MDISCFFSGSLVDLLVKYNRNLAKSVLACFSTRDHRAVCRSFMFSKCNALSGSKN